MKNEIEKAARTKCCKRSRGAERLEIIDHLSRIADGKERLIADVMSTVTKKGYSKMNRLH